MYRASAQSDAGHAKGCSSQRGQARDRPVRHVGLRV